MRKAAAACVTAFLTHNLYGAYLQLGELEAELAKKEGELQVMKEQLVGIDEQRIEEIEKQWEEVVGEIRVAVEGALEGTYLLCVCEREKMFVCFEDDGKTRKSSLGELQEKDASDLVRMYIEERKYVDAFLIVKDVATKEQKWMEML